MRRVVGLLLAGAAWAIPAPVAVACTCDTQLPVGSPVQLAGLHDAAYDRAFIGTVTGVTAPVDAGGPRAGYERGKYVKVSVAVETELAGDVPAVATLVQRSNPDSGRAGDDDCSFGFAAGRTYLVEAHANADGTLTTSICTFTQAYGGPDARSAPEAHEATARSGPGAGGAGLLLTLGVVVAAAAAVLVVSFREGHHTS